jgi:GrpB-like predicted nucleotidyltransferase (UPF0157 family)
LGLPKGKVYVVPYSQEWNLQYEEEKTLLLQLLNNYVEDIQHIGSTSINGIHSKPVVDIMVGVNSMNEVDRFDIESLKLNNYYRLKVQVHDKVVFAKITDLKNNTKTHIVHVVQYGGELWNKHIFFRDYLRGNEEAAKEYEVLKIDLADKYHNDEGTYTREKESFVNNILNRRTREF